MIQLAGLRRDGNALVFYVMLASALLLTGARLLGPFEVGKDQATQLEAAQNLVNGRGLTTTNDVTKQAPDIMDSPRGQYLTWWPPGFSLVIAGLLASGLSLVTSLKLLYAIATMAGWIGWGLIAARFLVGPMRFRKRAHPIHLVIAALLPLFTTLGWSGTDIFLWAGVPFLFLCLIEAAREPASIKYIVAAGLLFGALYSIRYASLFLALAALLILVQSNFPFHRTAVSKFAIFLCSAALFIVPTYSYSKVYATGGAELTDNATVTRMTSDLKDVFGDGIPRGLPVISNVILGFPLFEQALLRVNSRPLLYLGGLLCAISLAGLPLAIVLAKRKRGESWQHDEGLALLALPLSLVAFLLAVDLILHVGLLGIRRYYEPVGLCCLLVCYKLSVTRLAGPRLAHVSRIVVLSFVAYASLYMPSLALLPGQSAVVMNAVLGFVPPKSARYQSTSQGLRYPSSRVYSRKESSKLEVEHLARQNPQAIFYVEEYGYFIYDGFKKGLPVPAETFRVFPREKFWRWAYTSAPIRVFWVLDEQTSLSFVNQANQKTVFNDPFERTRIVMSDFPAGHRFGSEQVARVPATRMAPK